MAAIAKVSMLRRGRAAFLGRVQRRRAQTAASAAARERKVTLLRKYRVGELPDIAQVTPASFLAPLGESSLSIACSRAASVFQPPGGCMQLPLQPAASGSVRVARWRQRGLASPGGARLLMSHGLDCTLEKQVALSSSC